MTQTQLELLRALIASGVFTPKRSTTSARPVPRASAAAPGSGNLIEMSPLLRFEQLRTDIIDAMCSVMLLTHRTIGAIASVPFGSDWFAVLIGHELKKSVLMPTWQLSGQEGGLDFLKGGASVGSSVWIVDGDPDAADGDRLLRAAQIAGSPNAGCVVEGAAVLFERNGSTREKFLAAYPHATFVSVVDLKQTLDMLAGGFAPSLIPPKDAMLTLDYLEGGKT